MKNEALYHVQELVEKLGHIAQNIYLEKIKQSNKKPCFLTRFDLEKCSLSGFILQNDDNEWVFNLQQSSYNITQEDFNKKVKTSEFLKRQLYRALAKEAKINLSPEQIKEKSIAIKQARKFKSQ